METATKCKYWYPFEGPRGQLNRWARIIVLNPFDWAIFRVEYVEHGDGKYFSWCVHILCFEFLLHRFRNYGP